MHVPGPLYVPRSSSFTFFRHIWLYCLLFIRFSLCFIILIFFIFFYDVLLHYFVSFSCFFLIRSGSDSIFSSLITSSRFLLFRLMIFTENIPSILILFPIFFSKLYHGCITLLWSLIHILTYFSTHV